MWQIARISQKKQKFVIFVLCADFRVAKQVPRSLSEVQVKKVIRGEHNRLKTPPTEKLACAV
jgi:hypothetical protein